MIYSKEDFEGLRVAGRAAAETLDFITDYVCAGISTYDLDKLVAEHTKKQGGICAPLNYCGYPKHCCISVNDVICHGIPNKNEHLNDGDIVNIDVTTIIDGYYGDTSRTYLVGNVSDRAKELVDVTYESMMKAISICRPGQKLSEIGKVIQEMGEAHGFSIVRDFCGHGTGKIFHDAPNVLHYYEPKDDKVILKEGMVFTIEPMINTGTWEMYIEENDWTARTADGGLSAQFEHTLGITKNGVEIFTKSPMGYTKPPYNKKK
ncbi:MAG: type I methionyl aminopeptidase [Alphaproteobacteria bacterium]|jgi:methionyl aminopeptidase|nr:type I methionyl aminopeptidase [Alphaproteobacteria bacterium]